MRRNAIIMTLLGIFMLGLLKPDYQTIKINDNRPLKIENNITNIEMKADQEKVIEELLNKQKEKNNLDKLKSTGMNINTDLTYCSDISVEVMDTIINYYAKRAAHGTTFQGKGYVFIEAAKQTGLNPIYIFAHAALESDFGMSHIALTKHNYFGIAAYDSNPSAAYNMGNGVDDGIISGAKWIKKNYYDKGYTTLSKMNPRYCTKSKWKYDISSIINKSLSII